MSPDFFTVGGFFLCLWGLFVFVLWFSVCFVCLFVVVGCLLACFLGGGSVVFHLVWVLYIKGLRRFLTRTAFMIRCSLPKTQALQRKEKQDLETQ